MSTGSNGARKFEIRQAEDGYSLFVWEAESRFREFHGLAWTAAYAAAIDWLNTGREQESRR